jgi:TatD DNase family protein
MYFDAHAHLSSHKSLLDNLESVVSKAKRNRVSYIVDAAIDIKTSRKVLDTATRFPEVVIPTIGIHPEIVTPGSDIYQKDFSIPRGIEELEKLYVKNSRLYKAVGEGGLDFYWLERNQQLTSEQKDSIKKEQMRLLIEMINLALEWKLPLVVHSRGAEKECYSIVNDSICNDTMKKRVRVLFHSFTGSKKIAKNILESGYYISFNGIITYSNAGNVREIFKLAWKNRKDQVLAETDAPLLAPQRKRGEVCEPSDVRYIVEKMAEIVGKDIESVSKTVFRNAMRFYGI